jgi:hypothetical protein
MQSIISRLSYVVLGALALGGCIPAGINSAVESSGISGVQFPDVVGIDLEGKEVLLPTGLVGQRNFVAVAFEREQQAVVDTWITSMEPLLAQHPELRLYEVPTIYESSTLSRLWINNGMRAGITDEVARRRTVTVYVNREQFNAALSIPDTREVHLLLLNAEGVIIWRSTGAADDKKLADLSQVLVSNQSATDLTRLNHGPTTNNTNVR